MSEDLSPSHDEFFKNMMGRVAIARKYIQHCLPLEITSLMDMDTLEVDSEGYVDDHLKECFSDVVATVQLTDGQLSDIYILFEHKSGLDKLVRLQVLKYMVSKWSKWVKDKDIFEGYLPIVIPIVVYHGVEKWQYSTEFSDMFRLPSEDFRLFTPKFNHILHDISHVDEKSFKASVDIQTFLLLLKYIYRPELSHKLPEILSLLNELKDKDRITEYLPIIIKYILSVGKVSLDEIKEAVKSLPKGDETVETTADQLRQEGIQIGEVREAKGIQSMIQELLQERFDVIQPVLAEKVKRVESIETLKLLFRQALKTESMQEFNRVVDRILQPL
jgi:predicted transposase/invertase (TIGR01784 family)